MSVVLLIVVLLVGKLSSFSPTKGINLSNSKSIVFTIRPLPSSKNSSASKAPIVNPASFNSCIKARAASIVPEILLGVENGPFSYRISPGCSNDSTGSSTSSISSSFRLNLAPFASIGRSLGRSNKLTPYDRDRLDLLIRRLEIAIR